MGWMAFPPFILAGTRFWSPSIHAQICACLALHSEGEGRVGGSCDGLEELHHKKKLKGSWAYGCKIGRNTKRRNSCDILSGHKWEEVAILAVLISSSVCLVWCVNYHCGERLVAGRSVPSYPTLGAPGGRVSKENLPFSTGRYCGRWTLETSCRQ